MYTRPTRSQLLALRELSSMGPWKEARKLLEAELTTVTEKVLDVADDVAMRKLQGRGKFIADFLNAVDTADEQLARLRGA